MIISKERWKELTSIEFPKLKKEEEIKQVIAVNKITAQEWGTLRHHGYLTLGQWSVLIAVENPWIGISTEETNNPKE